jgi:RimJ/RimL family protein N-acetyltransferase
MDLSDGRGLLQAVKACTTSRYPVLSIPVGQPLEALLRPVVTREGSLVADDVRALTEWRNQYVPAFLTEFHATENRTARWLTDTVGPDDTRILFMIDDARGATFGYMGLAFIDWLRGSAEADAVVRGATAAPGTMTQALRTMLQWAQVQLGLHTFGVRVRSDNTALEFYRKFGFCEVRRVPLRKVECTDMVKWVEDPSLSPVEPRLVHMLLPD